MTKLYCPKGHENIKHYQELEFVQEAEGSKVVDKGDTGFCFDCKRRYFVIDCLTEPLNAVIKNSNSVEFDGIKTESQIAVDRIIDAVAATQKEVEKWKGSFEWAYFLQKLKELNK